MMLPGNKHDKGEGGKADFYIARVRCTSSIIPESFKPPALYRGFRHEVRSIPVSTTCSKTLIGSAWCGNLLQWRKEGL